MTKNRKVVLTVALLFVLAMTVAGCAGQPSGQSSSAPASKLKMAVDTDDPRTDTDWSQSVYEGYQALQAANPDVNLTFVDNVSPSDMPNVLIKQCQDGVNLIYCESAWYDAVKQVATQYPKVWFVMPGITADYLPQLPNNVILYFDKYEQSGYLLGVAAGMLTKTNKLGAVVGQVGYPDVNSLLYGFYSGAKSVNPKVTMVVAVTGDWTDIQKGYDCANAVVDAGADVCIQHSDNAGQGAIKAYRERKVYCCGEARDQSSLDPDYMFASQIVNHKEMEEFALKALKDGTISQQRYYEFGIDSGPMITPLSSWVPQNIKNAVAADETQMENGLLVVPRRSDNAAINEFILKQ